MPRNRYRVHAIQSWVTAGLLLLAARAVPAAELPVPTLHLVDERGSGLDTAVEVCFHIELRTECRPVAPGEELRAPAVFHGLRIEGAGHGPLVLRREGLKALRDGSFRVAVPRKALLQVDPAEPPELADSLPGAGRGRRG